MSFPKPGYVPDGWTRGETLMVYRYSGPRAAIVATICQRYMPAFERVIAETNVAFLMVPKGEEEGANTWLKWWQEPSH